MEVTIHIPDDLAQRLGVSSAEISRRALESFAVEELKNGRITEPELCRMLGLSRLQMDGFLKSHGVYEDITMEDVEHDLADLKSLGF